MAFFNFALQGSWEGAWPLAAKLIKYGFDSNIRQFRRSQAITLLSVLYRNKNIENPKLRRASTQLLKEPLLAELKGNVESKPKYVHELLTFLQALHASGEDLDWKEVVSVLQELRAKISKEKRFQDVRRAFNRICVPLKMEVLQGSDRKR